MTTLMTPVDAPGARVAGTDEPTGGAPHADAIAHFEALVDDALGSLEERGARTASAGAGTEPGDGPGDDEDAATATGAAQASVMALLAATPVNATPDAGTTGPQTATPSISGVDAGTTTLGDGAPLPGASGGEAATDSADLPGATAVDAALPDIVSDRQGDSATAVATAPAKGPAVAARPATEHRPTEPAAPLASSAEADDGSATEGIRALSGDSTDEAVEAGDAAAEPPATARAHAGGTDTSAPAADTSNDAGQIPPSPDEVADTPAPWQQLARAVHGVRRDQDGNHTMTVRLDPPELGTVELKVQIRDGRLHVHAATDSPVARDLIARAMPELRASLDANGITAGSLDVGARASGQGLTGQPGSFGDHSSGGGRPAARSSQAHGGTEGALATPAASNEHATHGSLATRLDLRL